eukprot:8897402-Pyramimonas_sp.AAC.1
MIVPSGDGVGWPPNVGTSSPPVGPAAPAATSAAPQWLWPPCGAAGAAGAGAALFEAPSSFGRKFSRASRSLGHARLSVVELSGPGNVKRMAPLGWWKRPPPRHVAA